MKLLIGIATSLALARWRQTLIAAIGVTFGVTMFIALLGFMDGLNEMIDGMIINRSPHIRLYNEIKPHPHQPVTEAAGYQNAHHFIHSLKAGNSRQEIYNSGPIIQSLRKDPRIMGLAPKISLQAFFNDGIIDLTGVVNGIDAREESRLFHFNEYIVAGDAGDIDKVPNSIILGKALAETLLVNLGENIQVTTAGGEQFSLKVVAFFQLGMQEYDKVQSFTSIVTAQKLLGKTANYITDIQIKLHNLNKAPALAREYALRFNTDTEDILTSNLQFETGSFIRSLISYAVGITLLIVAGFGIYNILNMLIYEKMDSIAIMKATGFSGMDVQKVFLAIALSIGFFGGMAGLLFGFLLSVLIDHIPFNTAALPAITTYPVSYKPFMYLIGSSFSMLTTFLAGWLPARKASKIDPVIIIRGK